MGMVTVYERLVESTGTKVVEIVVGWLVRGYNYVNAQGAPMATITTTKRSPLLGALAIFLLPIISCSCPSTPSVSSLSPGSTTAGGAGFVLTINGGNFNSSSVAVWNGTSLITSFVSGHQLTAAIPATDIAEPDTAVVYVYNPASANETTAVGSATATDNQNQCGAAGSNSESFTVSP